MSELSTLYAATVTGASIGLSHAFEPDHLAAVTNIVDEDGSEESALVGVLWGVGHSLPIVLGGFVLLVLGVRLPDWVGSWFELIAGAVLVYFGVRTLVSVMALRKHDHGDGEHAHIHLGPVSLGGTHSHYEGESFVVGIVHGLAGSGLLVLLVTPTVPTTGAAVGFVVAFGAVSSAVMGAIALAWGTVLGFDRHALRLRAAAGAISIVVGVGMGLAFVGVVDYGAHDHVGT
ncbi:MAG: hypothetical protein SV760_02430, partial [Halobacteria archaeon]|nr:hypothetical protein [Halobacteria archaeon]